MTASDDKSAWGVLVLRLTIGGLFIAHLYWKFALLEGGFPKWWHLLESANYPWIVPFYAFTAELAGAVLITLGIATRGACLYALPFMLGAAHFWLIRKGFFFTGAGAELPVVWALMLIAQCLLGDGALSLNHVLRGRRARQQCPSDP